MDVLDEKLGLNPENNQPASLVEVKKERPSFLTVLGILAFIGNGLGIFQGIFMYIMSGIYVHLFRSLAKMGGGDIRSNQDLKNVDSFLGIFGWWALGIILASIVCLVGAILMWKLKKEGFFIYVIGQMIPVVSISVVIIGTFGFEYMSLAFMISLLSAIFPTAFIVMFGLNLKHLK